MEREYETLGMLKLQFDIPCIRITYLDVACEANDHGTMALRAVIPESVTPDDVLRSEESSITVSDEKGGVIFSGMVTYLSLSHTAGYQELLIMAKSHSMKADSAQESGTFQSEGKTLAEVARTVLEPCGVQVTIAQDMPLPQMLSRQNETAWEFIRRIANEQGLYVYADSKAVLPHISIGLKPFSRFSYELFEKQEEHKNLADFLSIQDNLGDQVSSYQTAKQAGVSAELLIGTGCCLEDAYRSYAVVGSRIVSEGDLVVNQLTLTDPVGAVPVHGTQTVLQSTVLTGTVLSVAGVEVLVQFSSDGPAAGTRWILYESSISNYFYCMPNEGDQIFAYYQNDGTIVCLGSKWSGELPDFANPKDRALVAQKHMIKASEKKLEFVLERDYANPDNEKKTHISFKKGEGLYIHSETDLSILAPQRTINLTSRPKDWEDSSEELGALKAQKEAVFEQGNKLHAANGGDAPKPSYTDLDKWDAAKAIYKNMIHQQFNNNVVVSMISDIGARMSGSGASEAAVNAQDDYYQVDLDTTGTINICASDYMELRVGDAFLAMNQEGYMGLSASQYEMYGRDRENYERVELSNYTKRDQILDGVQCALGVLSIVAWLIPPPAGPIIAIAADVADAAISINRGDMIGAGLAVCGVVGDIAKAAKVVDAATTVGKVINTAAGALKSVSKVTEAIETVFGIAAIAGIAYSIGTTGYDIVMDIINNGWTEENKERLTAWVTNLARQAAQMLATTALKKHVDSVVNTE